MCIRKDRAMLRAYRGNVDDRAAFAGIYHLPNRCAHRVEGAAGGDREHVVPLLLSDLHELGLATISGAIDKPIDRDPRTEERRVGKEGGRPCKTRGWPKHK